MTLKRILVLFATLTATLSGAVTEPAQALTYSVIHDNKDCELSTSPQNFARVCAVFYWRNVYGDNGNQVGLRLEGLKRCVYSREPWSDNYSPGFSDNNYVNRIYNQRFAVFGPADNALTQTINPPGWGPYYGDPYSEACRFSDLDKNVGANEVHVHYEGTFGETLATDSDFALFIRSSQ